MTDPLELAREYINGKIGRRQFLVFSGIATAVAAAAQTERAERIYRSIIKVCEGIPNISDDVAILFRSVFSRGEFLPAISSHGNHHRIGATPPKEAGLIEGVFDEAMPKAFGIETRYQVKNISVGVGQNFLCLGSPSSNAHARASLGYNQNDAIDPQFTDRVHLQFWYERDKARRFGEVWRRYPSGLQSIDRWIIKDRRGQEYVQSLDFENTLMDDFLLISCVPNPYSDDSELRSFVVGGAHGLGSTGIAVLATNLSVLQSIALKIRAMNYWQALLRVSGIKSGTGYVTANEIAIVDVQEVVVR